jgi:hypothetical protein
MTTSARHPGAAQPNPGPRTPPLPDVALLSTIVVCMGRGAVAG